MIVTAKMVFFLLMGGMFCSAAAALMKPLELVSNSSPTRCSGMATMAAKA